MQQKKTNAPVYFLFTDVETTGLNYYQDGREKKNELLEISWILTDKELNILHKDTLIIGHKKEYLINMMDKPILEMHTENGLLEDVSQSCLSADLVDSMISQVISEYIEDNAKILLVGSSVSFDKEAIRRFLPSLYSKLYYRIIDVSSIRECLSLVFPNATKEAEEVKTYKHRAKEDIMETYNELRSYIKLLKNSENRG